MNCRTGVLDGSNVVDGEGQLTCTTCSTTFPVTHNIVDTLTAPSSAVVEELRGLAAERQMDGERWQEVKIQQVDHVMTLEERLAGSASEPVQYYQQTTATFEQAFEKIPLRDGATVLEIGVHAPFYFLERFRESGAECFALNILFFYEMPDLFWGWPHQALGDMNDLPYQDETFDIVLLSATAHHSTDLRSVFAEVSRVLVPGGRAVVINEPVEGLVKRLGSRRTHDRDEHVHEGVYRIWEYSSAIQDAGLVGTSYFPDYFDQKLRSGNMHAETRFRPVARLASRLWRFEPVRRLAKTRLLWPAQAVLGFPFNSVMVKPAAR